MRILANRLLGDPKVISAESGAVTAGLLSSVLKDEDFRGARDPYKYRSIVWDGELPSTGK